MIKKSFLAKHFQANKDSLPTHLMEVNPLSPLACLMILGGGNLVSPMLMAFDLLWSSTTISLVNVVPNPPVWSDLATDSLVRLSNRYSMTEESTSVGFSSSQTVVKFDFDCAAAVAVTGRSVRISFQKSLTVFLCFLGTSLGLMSSLRGGSAGIGGGCGHGNDNSGSGGGGAAPTAVTGGGGGGGGSEMPKVGVASVVSSSSSSCRSVKSRSQIWRGRLKLDRMLSQRASPSLLL